MHEHSHVQTEAAIAYKNFVSRGNIINQISNEAAKQKKKKETQENRHLFTRLLNFFPFVAKLNPRFRGHREGDSSFNKGNFLELIALLAKYNAVLQRHIEDARHDRKYFSPEIQNRFIQSLFSAVRKHILSSIKEAPVV